MWKNLDLIYKTFINPATSAFVWIGDESAEAAGKKWCSFTKKKAKDVSKMEGVYVFLHNAALKSKYLFMRMAEFILIIYSILLIYSNTF